MPKKTQVADDKEVNHLAIILQQHPADFEQVMWLRREPSHAQTVKK